LNLLGEREPEIYGWETLADVEARCAEAAAREEATVECFQSNHEGALLEKLHAWRGRVDGLVINAAGLTHTSVVLRDALIALNVPTVEVHISNVHAREPFRHHSMLSDVVVGVICGLGVFGYEAAISFLLGRSRERA
jgi:3-dehydroquinate dehydratase-2